MVYFSNDYSAEARWQSEDRAHRIGQTKTLTITDLTIPRTLDEKILSLLKGHKDMADLFKGDAKQLASWLARDNEYAEFEPSPMDIEGDRILNEEYQ
jgi:SNF2 family DNA or RNA helicase